MKEIVENAVRMRKRLIVKKGIENIALKVEDIALIYTVDKLVFVIDGQTGKKYTTDKKLVELEAELNPDVFFRANRKYIVSINFIKGFKPFEKVKIQVFLTLPDLNHEIIVSQESAKYFRKWIDEV